MDWKLGALTLLLAVGAARAQDKQPRPACLDGAGNEVKVFGTRTESLCRQVGARLGTVMAAPPELPRAQPPLIKPGPDPSVTVELHRENCYRRATFLIAAGTLLSRVSRTAQWEIEVTFVGDGRVIEVKRTRVTTSANGSANFDLVGPGDDLGSQCEFAVREITDR